MKIILPFFLAIFLANTGLAQLDSVSIASPIFNRSIQVFLYETGEVGMKKLIHYITDGEKMLDAGFLYEIEHLTKEERIPNAYYVFVSTIDKETQKDHRNEYFFANPKYIHFFENELITTVEHRFGLNFSASERSLIGVSFGGLNAAYFSATSKHFQNFGLLSPILYHSPSILEKIVFSDQQQLRIFLSSGKNDAEQYVKDLVSFYEQKEYELKVLYTEGGHDFDNWKGQLTTLLNFITTGS
ncbi:MAG: alpha/beta hydrolase-fold protein [Bacteroidota bacterium]